jgi:hypothetical protein
VTLIPADADLQQFIDQLGTFAPARPFAQALAVSAHAVSLDDLDPAWLAWAVSGVITQESGWGVYLRPRGILGSGDWTARHGIWLQHPRAEVVRSLPAGWQQPRDRSGALVEGPWAIPFDEQGWGRYLGQDDIGSDPEYAWWRAHPSPTAGEQIQHVTEDLVQCVAEVRQAEGFEPARLVELAGDVYNAGPTRFGEDLAKGIDPTSTTTDRYGARLAAFHAQWWHP